MRFCSLITTICAVSPVAFGLSGCQTTNGLPDPEIVNASHLNQHIRCLVLDAVSARHNSLRYPWLRDWVAEATLTVVTDRNVNAGIGGGTLWTIPAGGAQTLGLGPSYTARRQDNRQLDVPQSFIFASLSRDEVLRERCQSNPRYQAGRQAFSGDMGLSEWIKQVAASRDLITNPDERPEKFGYQLIFSVKQEASLSGTFSATNFVIVPNAGGDATDTYTLAIAFTYNDPNPPPPQRVIVTNVVRVRPAPGRPGPDIMGVRPPTDGPRTEERSTRTTTYEAPRRYRGITERARFNLDTTRSELLLRSLNSFRR